MHYNVCIVRPPEYIHSDAFQEIAELIKYSLNDCGKTCTITDNSIYDDGSKNIIIGCHLLPPESITTVPANSVILNTEQICSAEAKWSQLIYFWTSQFETWDYSKRNIERLKEVSSQTIKHLKLGFHKNLRRIAEHEIKEFDVLFYGSLNQRRIEVLEDLERSGVNVKTVFGVYGAERDALIAKSKIVLNMHYFESKIFEVVRVFYLMSNRKAVVCEVGPGTHIDAEYRSGIGASPYENLANTCIDLLNDEKKLKTLEDNALDCIQHLPQSIFMARLLS